MKIIILKNKNAELCFSDDRKLETGETEIGISEQYPIVVLKDFVLEGKNPQVISGIEAEIPEKKSKKKKNK